MSKLVELLKQLNIEPTPTKILLFKKWAKDCVPPENPNTDQDGVYKVNEFRKQILRNIEEG